MKADTERKKYYNAKNHQKTKRMNVHLGKDLRSKIKQKKRSLLIRQGDRVKVMRGPGKGTEGKVLRVSHAKMKVYIEGLVLRTAKGREVLRALQPSNLQLISLEQTKERKELFSEAAFKKEEKKKKPELKVEKPTVEAQIVPESKPGEEVSKIESKAVKEKKEEKKEEKKPETKAPIKPESKPETGSKALETKSR
jgi:large subunit ribosomal protein L24